LNGGFPFPSLHYGSLRARRIPQTSADKRVRGTRLAVYPQRASLARHSLVPALLPKPPFRPGALLFYFISFSPFVSLDQSLRRPVLHDRKSSTALDGTFSVPRLVQPTNLYLIASCVLRRLASGPSPDVQHARGSPSLVGRALPPVKHQGRSLGDGYTTLSLRTILPPPLDQRQAVPLLPLLLRLLLRSVEKFSASSKRLSLGLREIDFLCGHG
jgi:hypothetical protein